MSGTPEFTPDPELKNPPQACQYIRVVLQNVLHTAEPGHHPLPETPTEPCTWVKNSHACGAVVLLRERAAAECDDSVLRHNIGVQDPKHPCLYNVLATKEDLTENVLRIRKWALDPDPDAKL